MRRTGGLEVGSGLARKPVPAVRATAAPEPVETVPVAAYPDRDHDGIADNIDHCPDVAGLMETAGCPEYQKVIVKADKLEMKEKL